jgi:hypothetical protein
VLYHRLIRGITHDGLGTVVCIVTLLTVCGSIPEALFQID